MLVFEKNYSKSLFISVNPPVQAPSVNQQQSSNLQVTTLLNVIEIELKIEKRESFKLSLVSHNSQLTYSTIPGGYVLQSKIGTASILSSFANENTVSEQVVLASRIAPSIFFLIKYSLDN